MPAFSISTFAAGRPDAILLNGGVFNSRAIASRLVEVVSSWWPDASRIRVLEHDSLELAVARGAAWYGLVRRGMGRRIGGGAAHSFYIGLETKRGEEPKALCLIPRGHEEGQTVELGGRRSISLLGRPVQFPLFTSTSDRVVSSGEIVTVGEDLHPLPPIHTVLKSAESKTGQVPVHLRAILTEIGTLELWCVSDASNEHWRLEFELRGAAATAKDTVIESMPPQFAAARRHIEQMFGGKAAAGGAPAGSQPRSSNSGAASNRHWDRASNGACPCCANCGARCTPAAGKRRRSADHERVWFQLAGYTLRPGFGYPLDEWRCEQTAALFASRRGVSQGEACLDRVLDHVAPHRGRH